MLAKKLFAGVLSALAITCSCGICAADNYTITNGDPQAVFFYMEKTEQTFYKPNAYHVSFYVTKDSNKLFLADAEAKYNLLTFTPYEDTYVSYDVKEFPIKEANGGLFAISATAGAHAQNLGYWLVGVTNGQCKVLLDYKTLAKNGFKPDEWNRISDEYNDYYNALTILATTEYMPPWGQISADLIPWPKNKWACQWDSNSQSMKLKTLPLQRPAFIGSQDQAMLYMEQYLKGHPKFKGYMQEPGAMLSYSRHNPIAEDGLENHEIKIVIDSSSGIATRATFIINECADILFYDANKGKNVKIQ